MNRAIVVEESLLEGIQHNLDLLVEDWKREGADEVFVFPYPRGVHLNAGDLRNLLRSVEDLEGALLIGEIPVARVEDPTHFPSIHLTDQFFMELQGEWEVHDGNVVVNKDGLPPQVFIGRIFVGSETGWREEITTGQKPSELEFYNRYLEKLNRFRAWSRYNIIRRDVFGEEIVLPPWHRFDFEAIIINCLDDPAARRAMLEHLYPPEHIESHEWVTRAEFEQILTTDHYDWLWVLAHSTPGGHALGGGNTWNGPDYYDTNAKVNFIQIEGCNVASHVWEDHGDPVEPGILKLTTDPVVPNILFTPSAGVLVLASSLARVFPNVTTFYDKLKEGVTFGRAFLHWSIQQASGGWPDGGDHVLLFGDPFIRFGVQYYYCPIYTALEGTTMEPLLATLRLWRDRVFRRVSFGRLIIKLYYRVGSTLALIAGGSKRLRRAIRCAVSLALVVLEHTPLRPDRTPIKEMKP